MTFNSDNFSPKAFTDYMIEKMQLENTSAAVEAQIRFEIDKKLGNRVIETVVNAMDNEHLELYEALQESYPERSKFELLYSLLDTVPMLHEFMFKGINDLADEILYDIAKLDIAMKENLKIKK